MTLRLNDARTLSLADGTAGTSANNAAPDAFTYAFTAPNTFVFHTSGGAIAKHWEFSGTGVSRGDVTVNTPDAAMLIEYDFTGQDFSTGDCTVIRFFSTGQSGVGIAVQILTTGFVTVRSFAGTLVWTSPAALPAGRCSFYFGVHVGTTTANGTFRFRAYLGSNVNGTTADWDTTLLSGNAGTVNLTALRIGKQSPGPALTVRMPYFRWIDTQATETGLDHIPDSDTTAPTVPTGVAATVNSPTQVTVSWTASTDAVGVTSYRVRRDGVDVTGATAVTGTSFVDATVSGGVTYSYTVSAVDAAGNRSAESTAASATTPGILQGVATASATTNATATIGAQNVEGSATFSATTGVSAGNPILTIFAPVTTASITTTISAIGSPYNPLSAVTYVDLSGRFLSDDGLAMTGTIVLTPNVSYRVNTTDRTIVSVRPHVITLEGGRFLVRIPANGPTWRWTCEVIPDNTQVRRSFPFTIPIGVGAIDIADCVFGAIVNPPIVDPPPDPGGGGGDPGGGGGDPGGGGGGSGSTSGFYGPVYPPIY